MTFFNSGFQLALLHFVNSVVFLLFSGFDFLANIIEFRLEVLLLFQMFQVLIFVFVECFGSCFDFFILADYKLYFLCPFLSIYFLLFLVFFCNAKFQFYILCFGSFHCFFY